MATFSQLSMDEKVSNYGKYLLKAYPTVFNPAKPRPLAIGIHRELLKTRPSGTPYKVVQLFLWRWTNSRLYKRALSVGGHRFNLAGLQDGIVSAEQQKHD
jgi:sRNA-binding protein